MMYTQNRTSFSARNRALTNDDIRQLAPSVFADRPWHAMSERYTFIPTITIVDKMRDEGFQPYKAVQSNTRIPGKGDFTKHMIRFRDVRNGETAIMPQLGHLYPELILTNAHDGASAYKLDAGMFRLVCMNGLMVSQGNVSQINVRHTGNLADDVINASYEVVEQRSACRSHAVTHWENDDRIKTWEDAKLPRHPLPYGVGGYSCTKYKQVKGSFTLTLLHCDVTKIIEAYKGNTIIESQDIVFRRKIPSNHNKCVGTPIGDC